MKTAAIVRINGKTYPLHLWLSYYSKYFDDLYVVYCGTDPKEFENFKYNINWIDGGSEIYSAAAHQVVFDKQKELLKDHDWVIYTDADEFVIPTQCDTLQTYMATSKEKQPFCEGFNVFQDEEEAPIDYTKPILIQRKYWFKDMTGSYNKPALSRVESRWVLGFHKLATMSDPEIKEIKNTGLILIHLKYINMQDGSEQLEEGKKIKAEIPDKFKHFL